MLPSQEDLLSEKRALPAVPAAVKDLAVGAAGGAAATGNPGAPCRIGNQFIPGHAQCDAAGTAPVACGASFLGTTAIEGSYHVNGGVMSLDM